MKVLLNTLFDQQRLSKEAAKEVLVNIANERYNNAQIAAFMTVFLMRPVSVDELMGFREALLELSVPIDLSAYDTIDLCGTGGDGKNTFNISTLTSFIVAGAGYKVAKHGNYGVSSASGSSNVLAHLGYDFTKDEGLLQKQLERANICFLHAPLFHPAMKVVAPIRKELGVKTFFNMLGPLVNPSKPKHQLVGVFNLEVARVYHYILQQNTQSYGIVHALDGYDEISLTGPFRYLSQQGERLIYPKDLQLQTLAQSDIYGGNSVAEAATIFTNILDGNGTDAQENVVLTNAAFAIQILKGAPTFAEAFAQAKESLDAKKAKRALKQLIETK